MSDRQKNLLALLLATTGLLTLGATWLHTRTAEPVLASADRSHRIQIDTAALFADPRITFDGGRPELPAQGLLALFVLHAKVCPPCLNEVAEYEQLLGELRARGVELHLVALVFEQDPAKASRFVKVSGLPMPSGYGYPQDTVDVLGGFEPGQDQLDLQQMAFVDLSERTLFYRVLLSNVMTEVEDKRRVLGRMLQAWGRADHLVLVEGTP